MIRDAVVVAHGVAQLAAERMDDVKADLTRRHLVELAGLLAGFILRFSFGLVLAHHAHGGAAVEAVGFLDDLRIRVVRDGVAAEAGDHDEDRVFQRF